MSQWEADYKATSDCHIPRSLFSDELNTIIPQIQNILKIPHIPENLNFSLKSGKNIQLTLGNIHELECENQLDYMQNKENSKKVFHKYLKKAESEYPADLLVYNNETSKEWEFFNINDVVDFISNKCEWRKLNSGRLKGDFEDNSKKGKRQYITYEYRKTHKSYFLGFNGNRGLPFIHLLKTSIPYFTDPY